MDPAATPSFLVMLFLVFLSHCGGKVYGDDLQGYGVVRAEDFRHGDVCSKWKVPSGNALKVVHRYGPCSPSGDDPPDAEQFLRQDSRRVAYLRDRVRLDGAMGNTSMDVLQASLEARLPARGGSIIGCNNYIVTIGLGTPARDQTVMFDTGSSVCWVQCRPCLSCYPQREPMFDPATSSSYQNVTYNSPPCNLLPPGSRNISGNTCVYRVTYADSSSTTGFLARERLTLGQSGYVFDNFVFGCGHTNTVRFAGVAGLIGLGRTAHSLPTQASAHLGNNFSYCLPGLSTRVGYLTFGRSAPRGVLYTPMLPGLAEYSSPYFIDLVGISVARRRLPLSPTVFRNVHTVIDSGTVISRIPAAAYGELRTAFRNGMTMHQMAPPVYLLDTCYRIATQEFPYPDVTLHFNGVDLLLESEQVFYVPNASIYCLAFTPAESGRLGIIGNVQQRGMEVIYDIGRRRIGFSTSASC